jgi:uncharacterized membrane protein YdjX (TVP38/TMEM64 family)
MIDAAADAKAETEGSKRRRSIVRFLPLAAILILLVAVLASGVWRHLSLEDLKIRRDALKGFVHIHPVESVFLYMTVYCLVVALSIPGALMMTFTGGFLFGPWIGGAAAAAGVSSGAVIMFLVAHTALGDAVRKRARPDGMIRKVEEGVRRHAFAYLLCLRLMPAAPIWLVNLAAAFVRVPLWIYATATVIGIAPSCFIYASIGAGLDRAFAAGGDPDFRSLFHPQTFVALFALAALSLAPIVYQRWRNGRCHRTALPNRRA